MATKQKNPLPVPQPSTCQEATGEREAIHENPLLDKELRLLRATLAETSRLIEEREGDITRLAPLVARLSDTIARVKLADQRLQQSGEGFAWMQEEFNRVLRYMGLGSPDNAPRRKRRSK